MQVEHIFVDVKTPAILKWTLNVRYTDRKWEMFLNGVTFFWFCDKTFCLKKYKCL